MIFSESEAHHSDISQEERDILKQAVRELAEKIMRKCDKNSDDGLQNREAHDFLKDMLETRGYRRTQTSRRPRYSSYSMSLTSIRTRR